MPAVTYLDPNQHRDIPDDELIELRDAINAIEGEHTTVVRHRPRWQERFLRKRKELEPWYDVCHQVGGLEYQVIMATCGPRQNAYLYLLGYLNGLERTKKVDD